jgi:hypothetical protein
MATATRKPRRNLTPATVTKKFPAFRSGRIEAWAAVSDDGVWKYERIEDTGTLWAVVHVPTGIEADWCGTLTAARETTANGVAFGAVECQIAHQRGEHAAQRDSSCRAC